MEEPTYKEKRSYIVSGEDEQKLYEAIGKIACTYGDVKVRKYETIPSAEIYLEDAEGIEQLLEDLDIEIEESATFHPLKVESSSDSENKES